MRSIVRFRAWEKGVFLVTVFCLLHGMSVVPTAKCSAMTLSEEKEMGRKILETLRQQNALVEDGEILTYVNSVGNRILQQVGTTPYQYQFFVVNAAVPNAFAVPGGFIFIYRGLIEMMKTEGELASILSHEMAHIQARHIQRRMEESRVLNIAAVAGVLAGALLGMGAEGAQALALGGLAGARSVELKYSRDNETEADQLGFRYLCSAGYPPRDMVTVMQSLSQGRSILGGSIPTYLSTHPGLDERVLYLSDLVEKEKVGKKSSVTPAVGDFPIMLAALMAEYSDPRMAWERFQGGAQKGETAATYGLGRLYLRVGKTAESIPYLQLAARQQAGSPFILSTLGAAYAQEGKLAEAQKVLQTAILLDPSASIVHLRLAFVLQELGKKEEALDHLLRIESLAPMFPEIDYRLGTLLGMVNREGLAHFYLGRYYEQKRNVDLALFHYRKARALIMRDAPQKQEELDEMIKRAEKKKRDAFWSGGRK